MSDLQTPHDSGHFSQSASGKPIGRFIVLEGLDGAGKSSHIPFIQDWCRSQSIALVVTREPGGSPLAEQLRTLMLNHDMDGLTETLAVFAARRDHLVQTIWPALCRGDWVLSDRYVDSSWAYQGGGRGVSSELLAVLTESVQSHEPGGGPAPDLVLYFDLDPAQAAVRRAGRQAQTGETPDRFEREDLAFFDRVRAAYAEAAAGRGERAVWLKADLPKTDLHQQIQMALHRLNRHG